MAEGIDKLTHTLTHTLAHTLSHSHSHTHTHTHARARTHSRKKRETEEKLMFISTLVSGFFFNDNVIHVDG